jgi:single-stranded-DNA-specific exonuclease
MTGDLGPGLLNAGQLPLHVAGHLRLDDFRGGDAVQLVIDDAAPAT